jgi:hypothetical protein
VTPGDGAVDAGVRDCRGIVTDIEDVVALRRRGAREYGIPAVVGTAWRRRR